MPALNKQTLINLLIDSPLREPIKINLIDIVNNTNDVDLPKTYSTISKELEIFQKATERRMKLAEETIAKLSEDGKATSPTPEPTSPLPPLPPTPPTPSPEPITPPADDTQLKVPPLDLPPLPTPPTPESVAPTPEPAAPLTPPTPPVSEPAPLPPAPVTPPSPANADEDALKEIQKELDSLKASATEEAAPVAPPPTPQA